MMTKRICNVLLFVFILFSCIAYSNPVTRIFFPNTAINFPTSLKLGDEQWQLGNHEENGDLMLAEYLTNNEKIDNWSRLFTLQMFKFDLKKGVTTDMFANAEVSPLKDQGYKVIFNTLKSSPQDAIIEFRIEEPVSEQQDELQRIIIDKNNKLTVIHYVEKKSDMGDAQRKKWTDILKNFDLSRLQKK